VYACSLIIIETSEKQFIQNNSWVAY